MKEILMKVTVIFLVVMVLMNTYVLPVISVAVDLIETLIDEDDVTVINETVLDKYVNYNLEGENGVLVKLDFKTGIEYKESQAYMPIETTTSELKVPQINGEYPERVEVKFISTKATNGENKGFQYDYNKSEGKISVQVKNEVDENGNRYEANIKNARDNYKISLYYGADCYDEQNSEKTLIFDSKITEKIVNVENPLIKEEELRFNVRDNISGIVSTKIKIQDIYKGYINSNIQNGTKYQTEYLESISVDIDYSEISDKIIIKESDSFINDENIEQQSEDILYKKIQLNKENVLDILGEEGILKILDNNQELLLEVNKDTETNEAGIISIELENEINEIIIETTKAQKNGTLKMLNTKVIKDTMVDANNQKIRTTAEITAINNVVEKDEITEEIIEVKEHNVYEFKSSEDNELKEAETKVNVEMDKNIWTNSELNEVNFTATLITDNSKYSLFKNPVLEIKLPSEVENVILGEVSMLHNQNLEVKYKEVYEEEGSKVIKIMLEGNQNEYTLNSAVEGISILIPVKLSIKTNIESIDSSINVRYTNDNISEIDYEKEGKDSKNIDVSIKSTFINNAIKTGSSENNIVSLAENQISGELEVSTQTLLGETVLTQMDTIYEGQIVKNKITISNNTGNSINNLKVLAKQKNAVIYDLVDVEVTNVAVTGNMDPFIEHEYGEWQTNEKEFNTIEELESGKAITLTYQAVINEVEGNNQETYGEISIEAEGIDKIENETIKNEIVQGEVKLEAKNFYKEELNINENEVFIERLNIENIAQKELKDILVKVKLSNNLYINDSRIDFLEVVSEGYEKENIEIINYDEINNILTFKIKSLLNDQKLSLNLKTFTKCTNESKLKEISYMNFIAVVDEKEYQSNFMYKEIDHISSNIVVNQKLDEEKEKFKKGDKLTYTIEVTNNDITSTMIDLKDEFDGVFVINRVVKIKGDIEEDITSNIENNQLRILEEELQVGQKVQINVELIIDSAKETDVKINNKVQVYHNSDLKENDLEIILEAINPTENEGITDEDSTGVETEENRSKSRISGVAWFDENRNGQRDENEQLISDVDVYLIDADKGEFVKDNNVNIISRTNANGEYEFLVKNGNYIVVFLYDEEIYRITSYRKNGVNDKLNSDAISKSIIIDGNEKIVGITNVLKLENKEISNVDIGLTKKLKFDLKLDKYITGVTVHNSEGTKRYSYNKNKLAKTEIKSKYFKGSNIIVEYNIDIINEGELSAFAEDIVDYIPEGFEFKVELNKDWYIGNDKNLHNTTLKDEEIKVGEIKTLKLILIKTLKNVQSETLENNAEIYKSSNAENSKDIDSTVANKVKGEDDMSSASIIISIGTGAVKICLITLLIGSVLSGMIIYIMKKKGGVNIEEIDK